MRLLGKFTAQNIPPIAKVVAISSNENQNKRAKRETENRRSEKKSQEYHKVKTQMTKASIPNQPKQIQLMKSLIFKNHVQMAATDFPKIIREIVWTKITGSSQILKANTLPKINPEKRRIIFWEKFDFLIVFGFKNYSKYLWIFSFFWCFELTSLAPTSAVTTLSSVQATSTRISLLVLVLSLSVAWSRYFDQLEAHTLARTKPWMYSLFNVLVIYHYTNYTLFVIFYNNNPKFLN